MTEEVKTAVLDLHEAIRARTNAGFHYSAAEEILHQREEELSKAEAYVAMMQRALVAVLEMA